MRPRGSRAASARDSRAAGVDREEQRRHQQDRRDELRAPERLADRARAPSARRPTSRGCRARPRPRGGGRSSRRTRRRASARRRRASRPRARRRRARGRSRATRPAPPLERDLERCPSRVGQQLAEVGRAPPRRARVSPSAIDSSRCGTPTSALSDAGVPSAAIRPSAMIPTRSASWSASSRYWVVRKTVVPSSFRRRTSSQIAWRRDRVEAGGRLVEEQHARLVHERHAQVEAAAHAARVGADAAVGGAGQADALEQRVGAVAAVAAADAVQRRLEAHQLAAGHQRVERGLLERDADRAAHVAGVVDDVVAGDAWRCRRSGAAAS